MTHLETVILSFDNWTQPWTFHRQICADKTLSNNDLKLFDEIWVSAGDFELWNYSDLILGCKASHSYVKTKYGLADEVIAQIVRAISYQWK